MLGDQFNRNLELEERHGIARGLMKTAWENFVTGKLSEASRLVDLFLTDHPLDSQGRYLRGLIWQKRNAHGRAVEAFRASLAFSREEERHGIHYSLGISLRIINRANEALSHFVYATEKQPNNLSYQRELGLTLKELGRICDAEQYLINSISQSDGLYVVYLSLAEINKQKKDINKALFYLEEAKKINPELVETVLSKCDIFLENENISAALEVVLEELNKHQKDHRLLIKAASISFMLGNLESASSFVKRAIFASPGSISGHVLYAKILLSQGKVVQAKEIFSCALRMQPDDPQINISYAVLKEREGDLDGAEVVVDRYILSHKHHPQMLMLASRVKKSTEDRKKVIKLIEERLASPQRLLSDAKGQLHFSAGMLYDAIGEYDKAYHHISAGNMIRRSSKPFDREIISNDFSMYRELFTRDIISKWGKPSYSMPYQMIFVIGMPRSGTTLAERILASHSKVYGAGELMALGDVIHRWADNHNQSSKREKYNEILNSFSSMRLREAAEQYVQLLPEESKKSRIVVDKMPYNFMHLGFIVCMFPNVKIVQCSRAALDTLLSCYFQDFTEGNSFSYDLESCAWFYRAYESLMHHWKNELDIPVYDLQYEKIVSDPEKEISRLLRYCGLEYEETCLNFHQKKQIVHTASYQQVRKPIYNSSVGRWKNYEKHLGSLIQFLKGDLGAVKELENADDLEIRGPSQQCYGKVVASYD